MPRPGSPEGPLDPLLVRLIDDPGTAGAIGLIGLVIAVGVGAVHALGPGHGKALIGAYLAGSRGRARDAVALGVLVAGMHTGSVMVVASVVRTAQQAVDSQRLEHAISVVVALGVVVLGLWMLGNRVRTIRHRRRGASTPADTGRDATSSTTHGHHHHDLPDGVAPLSRSGILALAGAGGLVPSPVALLVLLTALATGRGAYGFALLLAFSAGLALTLTAVGLLVLWGRTSLARRADRREVSRVLAVLPLASAVAVVAGGVLLTWSAVSAL
ncbi:hypothetical protein [Nitriliruptor alkaliphilus]|uniref:HoxN/HupN/NixA family nickel/cobalt transporter n=1 Tax=Nitriliruptor alkaliphilus TaxID=427918 RepID=UPI0006960509|nr:hypothetical protein [Nitriliruptor alkaliphilus]